MNDITLSEIIMVITIILTVVIEGAVLKLTHKDHIRLKRENEELTDERDEYYKLGIARAKRIQNLQHRISELIERNINLETDNETTPSEYRIEEVKNFHNKNFMIVVGIVNGTYRPIKRFEFEIEDTEDREFALREAEELLDKLNEQ